MRAWLYCRVANGWDSDASDHLALQKTELERYCQEHGMTIVGTTTVTGSGKDELGELVHSAAEQDAFDVLAAVSISRIGIYAGYFKWARSFHSAARGCAL